MAGKTVSQVYEQGKSFNLVVRADEADRGSFEGIRNLMIDDAQGNKLPLYYVADIESSTGPNTINRENVKRKIVISANTSGRDLRGVVNDIQALVDEKHRTPPKDIMWNTEDSSRANRLRAVSCCLHP